MAAPGPIDSSSPFFASIAGQAAITNKNTKDDRKKKVSENSRFDKLLKKEIETSEKPGTEAIPQHLAHLPPEKILEALLDDVHNSGDLLKKSPVPENIIAYKNAVRSFVKFVVARTYDVTETISGNNILKRKKYVQIQVIDQKLEQLAAGILSNQNPQLKLLEKIEEINGLLVDLLS
ncbi:DUF327 family protein [Brucepastera parasyntrophica]|uniref:YaaR family protein n=1 Tax=Brucepastera parasyntrophica TaxID=2880008 RepID=UPI002108E650|nr:DUF327 family protein [Brucepastera parasyntrophica]ULQ58694.1 DUF327 family protein [Brucepastera parasyntrophica]